MLPMDDLQMGPTSPDEDRALARRYVERRCPDSADMLSALGLEEA